MTVSVSEIVMIKLFVFKISEENEDILLDKMSLLSYELIQKTSGYRIKRDRALSLSGKLMLLCFAERFKNDEFKEINHITDPSVFKKEYFSESTVVFGTNGKGYLEGRSDVFFNISHSKDYCVCAFSDKEIGVDIQEIRKIRFDAAKKFFSAKDNEFIFSGQECDTQDHETLRRINMVWCAKESYVKFTGKGIGGGIKSFYEDFDDMTVRDMKDGKILARLMKFEVDEGYYCFCSHNG